MSSLIVSHNSHLMMLEIAVENLFVPWTSKLDKVILKKTNVMFRMLDEEWTSLAPNRRDHRPYRGSNCENENFYGGRSIVFCVPAGFFEKKATNVDVQLYVQKEVCKYFEMDSCQNIGFATVSVNDLLNGIAKQMRERNELSEHLSDLYKQQIISRSTTGTYNLLDENFRNTAATISLYIRISYLGKCLVTEITPIESGVRGAFCARREPDEERYLSRQLTPNELQSGCWKTRGLPRIPRRRLVCHCEELTRKKDAVMDLVDAAAIAMRRIVTVDSTRIPIADVIKRKEALADYLALGDGICDATLGDAVTTEPTAISVRKIVTDAADATRREKPPIDALDLNDKKDTKRRAIARTKAKRDAIKDKKRMKTLSALSKSKREKDTTTGIVERGIRIFPSAPASARPRLQTYPLCCQLKPPLPCFIPHFDVLPCCCREMNYLPFFSCTTSSRFRHL